jgi:hypothetical protein
MKSLRFFWPVATNDSSLWNVRLGRVGYWVSLLIATAVVIGAGTLTISTYSQHRQSVAEVSAWEKRHAGAQHGPWEDYRDASYIDPDPQPYEARFEPSILLIGLAIGLTTLLAGRGFRYVVGGE